MDKIKLSVAIATYNEQENIKACLESVKNLADEIVIVDGKSTDKTVEIAQKYTKNIILKDNLPNFHINKQAAIDACKGEWILQLDADERISSQLKKEILHITELPQEEINNLKSEKSIFKRHQKALEDRDGKFGTSEGDVVAFFLARKNIFLGSWLKHAGGYPDGVIRLFQRGKAYLPCRDVHEQFKVEGRVGWLQSELEHFSDPDFSHYINRLNRYTNLFASEYQEKKVGLDNWTRFKYLMIKPLEYFIKLYIRHKGFLDGFPGFVFAFFSAMQLSIAYIKYWEKVHDKTIR